MFKIDSENGTIVWENTLPAGGYASPCVGENIVFMPCGYTQLSGLSKSTGELLWNYDFGSRVRATPKFLSGKEKMALLGTGNKFFGIDESGVIVYKVNLDNGMLFGEPIVIEDSIYFLGGESE
ncbi:MULTISPECIES: PQQ-binding-like beta-propeller repeat protein [unclassified Mammaliicoccus]|uniref:outer membrane protein assembly factor BamB family protein n=1 Tax=unclassified Mammaliicoccus TaxID=2803851 RepID=UPI001EFB8CCF|nr:MULTISPECIES: PQQ-binding-like beta-propeller repeat protein [unclassified Mammaliicoccus]